MILAAASFADYIVSLIARCWTRRLAGRWTSTGGLISWPFESTGVIDYPLVTNYRDSLILFTSSGSIGTHVGTRNSDRLHDNHKLIRFVSIGTLNKECIVISVALAFLKMFCSKWCSAQNGVLLIWVVFCSIDQRGVPLREWYSDEYPTHQAHHRCLTIHGLGQSIEQLGLRGSTQVHELVPRMDRLGSFFRVVGTNPTVGAFFNFTFKASAELGISLSQTWKPVYSPMAKLSTSDPEARFDSRLLCS